MKLGGSNGEGDLAPVAMMENFGETFPGFDLNCENSENGSLRKPTEMIKSGKESGIAMAVDSSAQAREPLQSLGLNSPVASKSPVMLRDGPKKPLQPAQNSPSDDGRISPLFKVPAGDKENCLIEEVESSAKPSEPDCDQPIVCSTPKARRVLTEQTHQEIAQPDSMMVTQRLHQGTENTGTVNNGLKTMTSGSGSASRIMSSVRRSKDFTRRAGRVLREDGEGVVESSPRSVRASYRRVTPMGWFPRGQRKESYLERKIRMLQQKEGGKIASLDETLGASNLHLCRVEREKRAASAAAKEASEASKAALVEASWCRILKAAGIPFMSAALSLQEAEKKAEEALAAAAALGVILGSHPMSPKLVSETDSGQQNISADLETAFDVDKEVATALKAALLRHTLDLEDEELRTAMRLITEQQKLEASSGGQPEWVDQASDASHAEENKGDIESPVDAELSMDLSPKHSESPDGQSHDNPLVESMLQRVKGLQPEQCTSLATIVATRGLSALLQEENLEQELGNKTDGGGGLGDVLIKHVSRLEAEKAAAIAAAKAAGEGGKTQPRRRLSVVVNPVPDLGTMFVKHVSRLEREKQAAIEAATKVGETRTIASTAALVVSGNQVEGGLDNVFVKKMSQLEKEKAAALENAENLIKNGEVSRISPRNSSRRVSMSRKLGLGESLIKHKSRLEREVEAARARRLSIEGKPMKKVAAGQPSPTKKYRNFSFDNAPIASLGEVLVKHKSRLEREKEAAKLAAQVVPVENVDSRLNPGNCDPSSGVDAGSQCAQTEVKGNGSAGIQNPVQPSLADMGVRKLSKLEMEKQAAAAYSDGGNPWARRRPSFKAREESAELWAGVSLGAALKRHVSKLQQEQAAWRSAEEEAGKKGTCVH